MLFKMYLLFTSLLAFYGFITLVFNFFMKNKNISRKTNSNVVLGLFVKNADNNIEGVVRNIVSKDLKKKLMIDKNIYIVDLGSKDDTLLLLQKLMKNYTELEVINNYQLDDIINKISCEFNDKR